MGWATAAIARLQQGQPVVVRPRGHSMTGKVIHGDAVTVEPLGARDPQGLLSVVRRQQAEALLAEGHAQQQHDVRVVVGDQHAAAGRPEPR